MGALLKALPTLVALILELLRWAEANKRNNRLKEIHDTIQEIKGAKDDATKAELAKKIADFWINPSGG